MKSSRTLRWLGVSAALVAFLIASGVVDVRVSLRDNAAQALDWFGGKGDSTPQQAKAQAAPFWQEGRSDASADEPAGGPPSFADLAQHVSPAVVNIRTKRTIKPGEARMHNPLEEFFGPGFGQRFGVPREIRSLGTGFVISPDGYIVTNNHVIEGVDSIEVHFLDKTVLQAKLVGHDPKTDVALIRVKGSGLPHLPLGNSDLIRPGDWVVAVGNPFGLEHTVTAGIVSAKHRVINDPSSEQRRFDDFIQTDAAINPGNSGGPLLNLSGEVVGINTAINPRANTIGFAIPINIAKGVLPQLKVSGHVSRGWLGVYIQPIDDDTAELMGLADKRGALVSKVEPGGPAEKVGIQSGDVIVEFNGEPVDEMDALPRLVAKTPVGTKVDLKVLRKGKTRSFQVALGELDVGEKLAQAGSQESKRNRAYGLEVQNLTPEVAERLGLENTKGVLIAGTTPGSPAAAAGLHPGDVILEVNQEPVGSVEGLHERLEKAKKGVLLLVRRGRSEVFIPLKRGTE